MHNTVKNKAIKASKRSAILTLLGFLIVMGSITYSSIKLNSLDAKVKKNQIELEKLEEDISEKKDELKKANIDLEDLFNELDSVAAQIEQRKYETAKKALNESIKPRVYIHSKLQLDITNQIAEKLKEKGYEVPKEEILVDKGPKNTQIRYFRKNEEKEANEILKTLREKLNIDDTKLTYFSEYETSKAIRPRHYEIWLGGITADNVASMSETRKDYWDWTIFIEAPDYVLDEVDSVEYTLHPTFTKPVITVGNRGKGPYAFALSTSGWGTFQIKIRVFMRDRSILKLTHYLRFSKKE